MYVLFVILRKLTFSTWCNVFIIIVLEVNVIKRDELADLETVNQGMVNWSRPTGQTNRRGADWVLLGGSTGWR